jgi:hypothetical protein
MPLVGLLGITLPAPGGAQAAGGPATAHGARLDGTSTRVAAWLSATDRAPVNNSRGQHVRTLALLGLERRIPLATGQWGALMAAPALLPALWTNQNIRPDGERPCGVIEACPVRARYATFGVGLLPLVLRAESAPFSRGRMRLVAAAAGGGAWFTDRLPTPFGARFNFLAQLRAGAEWRLGRGLWLATEVQHLHLSNGGRGEMNPGIDAELLSMGLAWR